MNKAFTLIELVIMLIIAGIAIPPLISLMIYLNKQSSVIIPYVRLNTFAVELMEEIKSKKWDENWMGGPLTDSEKTPPLSLGPDAGETSRNLYDDVDDYIALNSSVITDVNGIAISEYSDYRVTVYVYYVRGFSISPATPDFITKDTLNPPPSNTKRIDIKITKGSSSYVVSTLVSNY